MVKKNVGAKCILTVFDERYVFCHVMSFENKLNETKKSQNDFQSAKQFLFPKIEILKVDLKVELKVDVKV